ncbi:hypothetical protein [Methylobacterium sp. 391_Methyba4]|uniref:hypothetical protein n=1 Tax=Methylobacterium sp. 391_Methyba4 TaxID=3038924 RepID=UPI001D83400A|nr:hypothetical protein [Methylobacterium sp. 391_Methyba4]MBY0254132.1 hypothetical protein [Methylobacterium organophilum]WFS09598.1 hypothetical protein P9K36_10040 [Methylobacterium sp. 391_Methyba4]
MADKTLLFVHGTGVRSVGREQTVSRIRKGLAKAGLGDIQLDFVDWGEAHGSKVSKEDLEQVLPLGAAMALDDTTEAEIEAALWSDLLVDPLVELRMAALRRSNVPLTDVPIPGGPQPADFALIQAIHDLGPKLADPLPGEVTAEAIRDAARSLAAESLVREAARSVGSAQDPDLVAATARAIVATALRRARSEPGAGPSALYLRSEREALVDEVRTGLAPTTQGIGGWLRDKVQGFATARASDWAIKRRDGLMGSSSPFLGDILLYQRRGDEILAMIESKILELAGSGRQVIALGHSLGGIMLVDLLSRPRDERLPVSKLITVGSQAPMLFKFDALGTMRPGHALPEGTPFVPWLNIYDRSDLLSFCATRVFPDVAGIEDHEYKSGASFPEAHSAYFLGDEVYTRIKQFLG